MNITVSVYRNIFEDFYGLFGNYTYTETRIRKVSTLKRFTNNLTLQGVKDSEEIIGKLDFLLQKLQANKVSEKILGEISSESKKSASILKSYNELIKLFKLDDPFAVQFLENTKIIQNKIHQIIDLLLLYMDIDEARGEINEGNTVTIEEAFEGLV